MVCVAYTLAAIYIAFAIFLILEEWYPHHCEAYYTEVCLVRLLLWVGFLAVIIWSAYTEFTKD